MREDEFEIICQEAQMMDLLPCPFCGESAELICSDYKSGYDRVSCSCGAEVEGMDGPVDAVDRWNTRNPPKEQPDTPEWKQDGRGGDRGQRGSTLAVITAGLRRKRAGHGGATGVRGRAVRSGFGAPRTRPRVPGERA